MEQISDKPQKSNWLDELKSPMELYTFAREYIDQNHKEEFDAAWTPMFEASKKLFSQHQFMREYLWCVYVSGFSARVISEKYAALLLAHRIEDKDGNYITVNKSNVIGTSKIDPILTDILKVFGNKQKATMVQKTRSLILKQSWEKVYETTIKDLKPSRLQDLPGIGNALSFHLARNLGNLGVVKPDVHMIRLAKRYEHTPQSLCDEICKVVQEPSGKIDLVLWMTCAHLGSY